MSVNYSTGSTLIHTQLALNYAPRWIAGIYPDDLNRDGITDLLVLGASYPSDGAPVAQPSLVLFGTGNGGFAAATPAQFPFDSLQTVHPREVAFADFNQDGYDDVFVASHGYDAAPFPGEQNQLFLSNGDGTWRNATGNLPAQSDFTHSVAVGDINRDGALDIIAGNQLAPNAPMALISHGSGGFTRDDSVLPTGPGGALNLDVRRITAGQLVDLDGDGYQDFVAGSAFSTAANPVTSIVLWNQGGTFGSDRQTTLPFPADSGAEGSVYDIQAMDVNFDGIQDLVLAYQKSIALGGWEIQVLVNDGQRHFTDQTATYLPSASLRTGGAPSATDANSQYWVQFLRPADLNQDGRMDFTLDARGITAAPLSLPVAYIHQADGSFAAATVSDLAGSGNSWLFDYSTQYVSTADGGAFAHLYANNGTVNIDLLPVDFAMVPPPLVAVTLNGSAAADSLTGGAYDDRFTGNGGNDSIDGGAGTDTAEFAGNRTNYRILSTGAGYTVADKTGAEGIDTLTNIEKLQFADATLSVDYNDAVQALYVAYFGRAADAGGLNNFKAQLATLGAPTDLASLSAAYGSNPAIRSLIDSFSASDESKALYTGDTLSFVTAIYNNVLNRGPDQEGLHFWSNAIDNGILSRANASLSIMSGALSNTSTQGLIDKALVTNKIAVASNFTFAIDTTAEAQAYSGNTAAATVRSMLSGVSASTDASVFQATVESTLSSLSAPSSSAIAPAAMQKAAGFAELVGIPDADSVWG